MKQTITSLVLSLSAGLAVMGFAFACNPVDERWSYFDYLGRQQSVVLSREGEVLSMELNDFSGTRIVLGAAIDGVRQAAQGHFPPAASLSNPNLVIANLALDERFSAVEEFRASNREAFLANPRITLERFCPPESKMILALAAKDSDTLRYCLFK